MRENNYLNRGFHINPIRRENPKERLQKLSEKMDIRYFLIKRGYLSSYDSVRSPVKDYIHAKNQSIFRPTGAFENEVNEYES